MAQTVSISSRIEALEAAERRISAIEETKLSSKPMAEALSVSWPTLRAWCDLPAFADSGAFVRGGNGIEWEFDPKKTVAALLAHFRGEIARRQDRNRRVADAAGFEIDPDEAGRLDIVELSRQNRLMTEVFESQVRRGDFVKRTHHEATVSGVYRGVRDGTLAILPTLDPTGRLFSLEQRKEIERVTIEMIISQKKHAQAELEAVGATLIEERDC